MKSQNISIPVHIIYIYIYTQKKGKMSNLRMDNINYVSSPSGTQSKNQKTSNETN